MNKYTKMIQNYWINTGRFYKRSVLDLTDFLSMHPGGQKAIQNYKYKDITLFLFKVYPHDQSIIEKIMKYKIGQISLLDTEQNSQRLENKSKDLKPSREKSNLKASFLLKDQQKQIIKKTISYKRVELSQSDVKKQGEKSPKNKPKSVQLIERKCKRMNCKILFILRKNSSDLQQGQQNHLYCQQFKTIEMDQQKQIKQLNPARFLKDIAN